MPQFILPASQLQSVYDQSYYFIHLPILHLIFYLSHEEQITSYNTRFFGP
jgi:hypothetical protein